MPTNIEWTGESWNPIRARALDNGMIGWHCEHASPGCQNCYAETQNMARRFNLGTDYAYKPGHRKDIEVFLDEAALVKPFGWKKGRKVFVCSMTDLFADFVTDEMIDRIFAVMALCPQHTFQVLTKRSARMREYLTTGRHFKIQSATRDLGLPELKRSERMRSHVQRGTLLPLPNVWLGVSVEDQQRADERIPDLLATPAAIRWISAEPLLGPVSIIDAMWARDPMQCLHASIDWVVVGGESGSKARPMHPDWARSLRDQCAAAGVPFFFKQWGEWRETDGPKTTLHNRLMSKGTHWLTRDGQLHPRDASFSIYHEYRVAKLGKKRAGRLLDGVEHNGMPER